MKTNLTFLAALTFVVIFCTATPAFGQVAGDYRSSGSGTGNWIDPASWQTFDGSNWNTASTPPPGTSGTITIQPDTP